MRNRKEEPLYLDYDDVLVGHKKSSRMYEVSAEDIVNFARQWNPEPFHLSASAAQARGFDNLFASGVHLLSVAVKLCNECTPLPRFVAGLAWDEIRFHLPVYAGDAVRVEMRCVDKRRSSAPGRAVFDYQVRLLNQAAACVLSYSTTALAEVLPGGNAN